VTEIGRRTGLLSGVTAFTVSALIGIFTGGDLFMSLLYSLIAGLIFGVGGVMIGNLFEDYTFRAARRQLARQALERELDNELRSVHEDEDSSQDTEEVTPEAAE
jgi:hypothetical protein